MMSSHARIKLFLLLALPSCLLLAQNGGSDPAAQIEERLLGSMHGISSLTILEYVKELTSDRYQGRLTGTPGYDTAARWAAGLLARMTFKPLGDDGTYLQHFPNPYTLVLPGAELILRIPTGNKAIISKPYVFETDFFPGSTSDSGSVTAEVIYVGYGISAPELDFDEYAGIDTHGRIVLVEPEVPVSPDKDPVEFMRWRPYSFHDYKVQNAKRHGAAGMVYAYHIANPNCVFVPNLLLTYVGASVVDDLFLGTGRNHTDLTQAIRTGRKPASFAMGKVLTMKNRSEHHPEGIGSNVIGWMEGVDPVLKREAVIIGAHLDHLGMNHVLMPGANDNASGVSVTLAAAEAIAKSSIPLRRSVLIILFGAEEQGVKGSEYYISHPVVPNGSVKGFINLESVGRGERIEGGAGKNYPNLWEVFERNNRKFIHRPLSAGYAANIARPRQDAAYFLWAGIPSISFGTSGAPDLPYPTYHTTRDSWETLTPEIMEDLARLVFLAVIDIAESDDDAGR
jgi:hypothetical protein